jgi:hypothetical protein
MKKTVLGMTIGSVLFAVVACDDPRAVDDGGTAIDAAGTTDAAASDAPASDAPASDAPRADDAADPLVTECQRLADVFATHCAGSGLRPCIWQSYRMLCRTGNTQLLVDSMRCLDETTCRTFSDPNDGEECLRTTHQSAWSTTLQSFSTEICTACGGTGCDGVQPLTEIVPYIPDAEIAELSSCRGEACDLESLLTACRDVHSLAAFYACVE